MNDKILSVYVNIVKTFRLAVCTELQFKMNSVCLLILTVGVLFASVLVSDYSLTITAMKVNFNLNIFIFHKANDELGKAIKSCRLQYPHSDDRTVLNADLVKLSHNDKCYLLCILTAQKLVCSLFDLSSFIYTANKLFHQINHSTQIVHGVLNVDSLQYATNDQVNAKIKTKCGTIRDGDECELAAKIQKCIQDVLKSTPIA